jgi:hypothetical protein
MESYGDQTFCSSAVAKPSKIRWEADVPEVIPLVSCATRSPVRHQRHVKARGKVVKHQPYLEIVPAFFLEQWEKLLLCWHTLRLTPVPKSPPPYYFAPVAIDVRAQASQASPFPF